MKRQRKAIIYYAILALVYLILELVLPANKIVTREYSLNPNQYHVLLLLLALPIIGIWCAAFFGYSRLKAYADSLGDASESAGFKRIADGFMWLAWGLPIPTIISLILNSIANSHSNFHSVAIISVNYVSMLIPLIAFLLIADGVRQLPRIRKVSYSQNAVPLATICFMLFAALYIGFTVKHFSRAHLDTTDNPYYLSFWTVFVTLTIPYLIAWFCGLYAALRIIFNSSMADGLLYRRGLLVLAAGNVLVIISFIALQYVGSVVPRTGHLALNLNLATTYAIRIVTAVGYILIAVGAQRLKRIEEV